MDKFTKFTILIIGFLVILIAIFAYLGSFQRNHVRYIDISGGVSTAEYVKPRINIKFSRPVNRDNIGEYISIYPETEMNINFIQNDLQISFPKNLNSDTEYIIKLSRNLKDVYSEEMDQDFEYEFRTKPQYFTFIKTDSEFGENDKIIFANLDLSKQQILFESKKIKKHQINNKYLAVIIENDDKTQDIHVLDFQIVDNQAITKTRTVFGLENYTIFSIDLYEDNLLFISQLVEPTGLYLSPKGDTSINIFNLVSGDLTHFNPGGLGVNSLYAEFTPDGENVIFRAMDYFFYMASIDNSEEIYSIGKFKSIGGMNYQLNKIAMYEFDPLLSFSSFPFISIFDTDRNITRITQEDEYVLDPTFMSTSDRVIYASRLTELNGAMGIFYIKTKDIHTGEEKVLLQDENFSLEIPKPSYDDRFIAIEKYSQADLLDYHNTREYVDYRKPKFGDIIIFDVLNSEIISECSNCIEAKFLE